MEIWLQQQAYAVLAALCCAQDLYGGQTTPRPPRPFMPRPDLEADLGGELR